eukprot:1884685-Rhodomonas_salina.3
MVPTGLFILVLVPLVVAVGIPSTHSWGLSRCDDSDSEGSGRGLVVTRLQVHGGPSQFLLPRGYPVPGYWTPEVA